MLPEFRYQGLDGQGRVLVGYLHARSHREARLKTLEIARQNRFRVSSLEKKATYAFRVQKGRERPSNGEQKAFSKSDVERAFKKLGYRVLFVRKKLVTFQPRPPVRDVALFIRMCADLLKQGITFEEILRLQLSETSTPTLRETIREIHKDLRDGREGPEVFRKHEDVFGPFAAQMLSVASQSDSMSEIFEHTAKFLERKHEFKKTLRSALVMPSVVLVALFVAVGFYIGYIFPKTAEIFSRFDVPMPPMTAATLSVSAFFQSSWVWLTIVTGVPFALFLRFLRTDKGRIWRDRTILSLPVVGSLVQRTAVEVFCRVFHTLYQGEGKNIETVRTAATACGNLHIERRIKDVAVPLMAREGLSLVEALRECKVFTHNALSRLANGAESGTLKDAALQVAQYYESETSYKLRGVTDFVQLSIAIFVTIAMTFLTLVSSESATIKPRMPSMQ